MKTVYLCGGINGLSDAECRNWREEAERLLIGFETLDPMRRDYRGREDDAVADIVRGDLADIDRSHAILANCVRPSWGTAMEVFYASTWHLTRGPQLSVPAKKPVVAVVPSGPVSPWLRHHADAIVVSLADGAAAIRRLLEAV